MPEEQKGRAPVKWVFWLAAATLIVGVMLGYYYVYPEMGIGPKQPIPFSHRVHAGVKRIECQFCHPFPARSANSGIPVLEKCFFCHNYVIPDHYEIVRERRFYETGTPVPWIRVFWIPDFVKFNHQPHIRWADLECGECHGAVEQMDRLQTKNFKMGFCIDCHYQMNAQLDCYLTCHH